MLEDEDAVDEDVEVVKRDGEVVTISGTRLDMINVNDVAMGKRQSFRRLVLSKYVILISHLRIMGPQTRMTLARGLDCNLAYS